MKLFDAIRMSETELNTCWDKIIAHLTTHNQQHLVSKLGKVPPVIWSKFGFHVAGRYCWTSQKDKIEMNTNFLNINNPEEFVISTMRHEAAHCINNRIGSGGNHDKTWKTIATILGDDANIYHNYEKPSNAPVRQVTIYEFYCTCGQMFSLTTRRLESAKKGKYLCKSCKKNLRDLFDSNGNLL